MYCDKKNMHLYAVTDRGLLNGQPLQEQVEKALKGGVTCLQLREKNLDYNLFLDEAISLKKICSKYKVPFIVNDNVDIALKSNADGIHIGQEDDDILDIKKVLGEDKIIGVSVQNVKQAIAAEKNDASYLGVGAVFKTSTKEDAKYVSYDILKSICENVSIPVVAIGGIKKDNIIKLAGSKINGIAMVSAIFGAEDVENECRELLKLSKKILNL